MHKELLTYLRCPATGSELDLFSFVQSDGREIGDVRYGLLRGRVGGCLYPIVDGVPSMLPDSFTPEFLSRFAAEVRAAVDQPPRADRQSSHAWSFSEEWDTFFTHKLTKTWGWTLEERVEMLLLETQLEREAFRGALVCDGGCGNGLLIEAVADLGATAIGIDYSTSVFAAEAARRSDRVHYVRGDLNAPPFKPGLFDLVFSSGVLHYSPSTRQAFSQVAELVKPDGRFYLWLYRRSRDWKSQLLQMREKVVRPVCIRLPRLCRKLLLHLDAATLWALTGLFAKRSRLSYQEALVNSYNALTPRFVWQHHTPQEVASWFHESGFGAPGLTHWDNPSGFGMVARKRALPDTPGLNFGKRPTKRFVA